MKVGIVQIDGKLPNMALMQITGFHEQRGDLVEWYQGPLWAEQYEKIYASKIFSFSKSPVLPARAIIGGTGIDFYNTLPPKMINSEPSYTLYPNCNYHIGFSMKGCRFSCKFCCVPKKEGRPSENSLIDVLLKNPRGGNRLVLLDNDFFGGPRWRENITRLIQLNLKVCFVQGLNIRIITQEQATLLAQVNYTNSKFNQKYLTFAWDRYLDGDLIRQGIERCRNAGIPPTRMQFFVLIGFNTSRQEDYDRVMTLRSWGCMPFVMPYQREDRYQRAFARWVNNRAVFKSCDWNNYKYKPMD